MRSWTFVAAVVVGLLTVRCSSGTNSDSSVTTSDAIVNADGAAFDVRPPMADVALHSDTQPTTDASSTVSVRVSPPVVHIAPNASQRFIATVTGSANTMVTWTASAGSIDQTGLYTSPAAPGTYQVTATSVVNASINATAMIVSATVGDCNGLPTLGTWENITPQGTAATGVNGNSGAAIVVDPFDARTVWLGTGRQGVWRSDNCGGSWTRVNTGPGGEGDHMTFGGVGDGTQWSMMVDPVDAGVMYAVSGYGAESLWKSIDGGHSWTDVLLNTEFISHVTDRFVNNVSMDASNHLHLVVESHGGCSAPYAPSCMAETLDGGATWRTFVAPEAWTEGGGIVIVSGSTWAWCGPNLLMTRDSGATWSHDNLAGGGGCEAEYTIRPFVPAANGNYYLGSRNGVIRSHDGWSWEHVPNTNGWMVMMAQGSTHLFAANQWMANMWSAPLSTNETWTALAPPTDQINMGTDNGIPFLAYDDAHHVLYASMFSGGVARTVIP